MEMQRADFINKVKKIRDLSIELNVSGIVVESQANFAWLTGGRGFVGLASEMACASLVISKDNIYLVSNNVERPRLCDEEINNLLNDIDIKSFYWYNLSEKPKLIDELLNGEKYLTDTQLKGEFQYLRSQLSELDIERYLTLGKNSAEVVESICRGLKQGVTEFEVAGIVSRDLWSRGIEPVTILVAFDERIRKYRHPVPTDNRLKKHAMVVICGRKWGLYASLTRLVSFGDLTEELKSKHEAVAKVDACLIASTRPGTKITDIFDKAKSTYDKTGYGNELKLHHQGGLTGYMAREYIATMYSNEIVRINQAFAWNPSITGTKSEDTILVMEDGNRVITHTGEYPYLEIDHKGEKILRPDILVL